MLNQINKILLILILAMTWITWSSPARGEETHKVFRVNSPGTADARDAIRQAIDAAVKAGPGAEVRLGPGRFNVNLPPGEKQHPWCFTLGGVKGLVIRGETGKTEIVFKNPASGGFFFSDCTDVFLKDLIFDYDPVPYTQGLIKSVDTGSGSFDLELEAGYPSLGEPWFKPEAGYDQLGLLFDARERHLKFGAPDFFIMGGYEPVKDREQLWCVRLKEAERGKAASMAVGDRFALLARGGQGFSHFGNCTHSGLEGVTVHASPSLTVRLIACDGMELRGFSIAYRPGTTRLMASNGDGIHCQRNTRGPLVEGCLFEGLGDDAMNIYAPPLIVRQVFAHDQLLVAGGVPVRVGDQLQILDPQAGKIRAAVKAVEVKETAEGSRIRLERPVEGMRAGADHRSADTIYNLSACGAGAVIRGNTMRWHRRHGVLLRGSHCLIEGNRFEMNGGFGVVLGNEPEWPEGPVPFDVTVRGNQFIGGGYCAGYGDSPLGASVMVRAAGIGRLAEERAIHNLTIEGNQFTDPPGAAVYLGAVKEARLTGNQVKLTGAAGGTDGKGGKSGSARSGFILLEHCAGVEIKGLDVTGPGVESVAGVRIMNSVAPGAEGAKLSGLGKLPNGQAIKIQDERKP